MKGAVTDDALALEARRGDGLAMAAIFRSYHLPLYRFCLAIVGNPQDAQDALQNTMVTVLRALPGERRHIALKPWLYRIAHNQSIDLLRRRRPGVPLDESAPAAGEELAVRVEMRQRLRQLIADLDLLPKRQRETLLMREAADLDFEEIAAALETTAAAARQALYEARLSLRQMETGREMDCGVVTGELSDGDGRVSRRRDLRAHLRACRGCRQFVAEIDSRRDALAAIAPLPPVAAAAILHGLVGGGSATAGTAAGAGGGSGLAGLLGGGAAKSLGTATLLKGVTALALVAAIGVGAADRNGLIHLGGGDTAPVGSRLGSGPAASDADLFAAHPSASSSSSSAGSPPRRGKPNRSSASVGSSGSAPRPPSLHHPAVTAAPTPGPTAVSNPTTSNPTSSDPAAAMSSSATGAATPSTEAGTTSPGKSGAEHPSGQAKHEKQLPAAAAHGQEMAASHRPEKAAGAGGSGSPQAEAAAPGAEHPAHPVHPVHPSKSATAAEPSAAEPPSSTEPAAAAEPPAAEPLPAAEPAAAEPAGKPPHGKKP
jgi:RNA polymerase sigma factor (sigma-70 family)